MVMRQLLGDFNARADLKDAHALSSRNVKQKKITMRTQTFITVGNNST
jgi:hypothetical protein